MKNTLSAGFILIYTVLILSVILMTGGIFVNTILKEVGISRDEIQSLKAFYAADAGIECVRYYNDNGDHFNTKTPSEMINCGDGTNNFTVGGCTGGGDCEGGITPSCESKTWSFQISGFPNGSCVKMTVTMVPNEGGVCTANVVADGLNQCSDSGEKQVERTRWETM